MLIVDEDDPLLEGRGRGEEWWYNGQPFTGVVVERDVNGAIVSETDYHETVECGGRTYFANGNLKTDRVTEWEMYRTHEREFYENGQVAVEKFHQARLGSWEMLYSETGEIISGIGHIIRLSYSDLHPRQRSKWDNFFSPVTLNIYHRTTSMFKNKKV